MKCTACGNENQPGAKFCVHCGIVLVAASAPAAPAAVAAAKAPESSPKTGLIIGVVALLVVLGAGGYFGYRMLGGGGKETVAIVEPPKPAETPPSPAASPPAAPATGTSATRGAAATAAPAASPPMFAPGPATGAESKTVPPAPTGVPLPGRPSTAEGMKADSGQTKAAPKAAPPSSKALAKAPAVAPTTDRWQMMAEAMAQCAHAQFFSRLACEQRTRNQYCEGYWGQVARCPSAPTKDHGQ